MRPEKLLPTPEDRLELRETVRHLGRREVLPLFAAYLSVPVAFIYSPSEASLRFYESAAQIIPVLMLVLAVEARLFHLPSGVALRTAWAEHLHYLAADARAFPRRARARLRSPLRRPPEVYDRRRKTYDEETWAGVLVVARTVLGGLVLAALTVAELAALHPLAQEDGRAGNPRLVYAGIAAGLAAAVVVALSRR